MGKATGSLALLHSIEAENIDNGWPLVERQNIIDFWDNEIFNGPLNGEYKCFLLCGNGGMGKSFCCDWYLHNIRSDFKQFIYYDFDLHKEDVTAGDILLKWVKLIVANNNKYRFNSFTFTYNQYEKVLGKTEKSLRREMIQNNDVVNGLLELISMGNSVVSSSLKIAEISARTVKKLFDQNKEFYKLVYSCEDITVLEKLLVVAFCKDMEENLQLAEYFPFVFFIDTYESYVSSNRAYTKKDGWIESIISALPNCIWIIASREIPEWQMVQIDQHFNLGPINADDAFKEIFEHAKIFDESVRSIIQKKSAGNPYYIQRLVKEYLTSDEKLYEEKSDVILVAERILRYMDDETSTLAYALSYLENWDSNYLHDYTSYLGLNGISMSTLCKAGVIHDNHIDKHVSVCLQEAIDIDLLKSIFTYFKDKINIDDADYYSRNRYLKSLLILYKHDSVLYEDEVEGNLARWSNMAGKKLFDAFEKEFLPFWDNINKGDKLYIPCLIVYRVFLDSAENKNDIWKTIQPDVEDEIYDFVTHDNSYLDTVLLNYSYIGAWDYADRIINYINNTSDIKELDEIDRLCRLRALINYYSRKGEWDKAFKVYEFLNDIEVTELNAISYITVMYEMLAVIMDVRDIAFHKEEMEKAYMLGQKYLKDGSILKHYINNEYLMHHNKWGNGEDTSELAWDEYRYTRSFYTESMVEGIADAKLNLLWRLYDNEKYDELYPIADEVASLYSKYPLRCEQAFLGMRIIIPQALLRQKKYELAIKETDSNLPYVDKLPENMMKVKIIFRAGYIYWNVAMANNNDIVYLKKANKFYIEAIKLGKKIWGDDAIQLQQMYYQLANVKFYMLEDKQPAINMLEKSIDIYKKFYGDDYPEKEDILKLLSIFKQHVKNN